METSPPARRFTALAAAAVVVAGLVTAPPDIGKTAANIPAVQLTAFVTATAASTVAFTAASSEVPAPAESTPVTDTPFDVGQLLAAIFLGPFVFAFFGLIYVISMVQSFLYNQGLTVGSAAVPTAARSVSDPRVAESTALVLCGTTCPTPDAFWVESVANQFVAPTHPSQHIDYVAVTAPMEFWPITGLFRLIGLAIGDSRVFGPGGASWPEEPLWKLSGLFDLTADQSVQAGADALEAAMAANGDGALVIYGYSQGAGVANVVKKRLAEQYPVGTPAPDVDFVLGGDPNLPNGGLMSRFPGLYIPIINMTFNGPAATDTQFTTVEINRQYDGFSDFPLYPGNLIADLNAVMGALYLHTRPFDVSLPADPSMSPAYQGTHGDTSYYFFETPDLPLFSPLRTLGVRESLIDVVEPVFRVLVELGYDRTIPAWQPTPARLDPRLDPAAVATDLAAAIFDSPPPSSPRRPEPAATQTDVANADQADASAAPPEEPEDGRDPFPNRPHHQDDRQAVTATVPDSSPHDSSAQAPTNRVQRAGRG